MRVRASGAVLDFILQGGGKRDRMHWTSGSTQVALWGSCGGERPGVVVDLVRGGQENKMHVGKLDGHPGAENLMIC